MSRLLLIFITGVVVGVLVAGAWSPNPQTAPAQETALEHARKHLDPNYVCPMHAEIVTSEPGSCPICGMDLVPVKSGVTDDGNGKPLVQVPYAMINNLGVRVDAVRRGALQKRIDTPGFVQQIRAGPSVRVKAPAAGEVTKLLFEAGTWLQAGDALYEFHSDAVHNASAAYIDALTADDDTGADAAAVAQAESSDEATPTEPPVTIDNDATTGPAESALDSARKALQALGFRDADIAALDETLEPVATIVYYAPIAGQAIDIKVEAGNTVEAGEKLFDIKGEVRANVLANAFQRDAASIFSGQKVEIHLPGTSNKTYTGIVTQGAVSINTNTQNIGVRLAFNAPVTDIRPGLYVEGTIIATEKEDVLIVPRAALIQTGHETRVVKALGDGRFQPVAVETGIITADGAEIVSGLADDDAVVSSGQFLLDSESSIQAGLRRFGND